MANRLSRLDKANYAIGVFGKLGVSKEQAFGILGGLSGESGLSLNTGAFNPNDPGGSVGIGQWNRERKANLKSFADKRNMSWKDYKTQVDFIAHELSTTHKSALAAVKAAPTRAAAASAWVRKYEMPDPKYANTAKRQANANYYAGLVAGTKRNVMTKDVSYTGANLPAEEASAEGTVTAYAGEDVPTPTSRPEKSKSVFGRLTDTLNEMADGVNSLGETATGAVDEAGNKIQKASDPSFFGDTSVLGAVASIAGGLVGGAPGAILGGLLGQGIDRVLNKPDDGTATEDGDVSSGIGGAIRSLFGSNDDSGGSNFDGDWGGSSSTDSNRPDREPGYGTTAAGGMFGGFFGGDGMGQSESGSHGEGPGYGGSKSGESKSKSKAA
jgi:hypothetical protein